MNHNVAMADFVRRQPPDFGNQPEERFSSFANAIRKGCVLLIAKIMLAASAQAT